MGKKIKIQTWSAIGMLAWGSLLTTVAFFVEPIGEIHESVLWCLGQVLIYAGSVFGVKSYIDQKLSKDERNS